mgnify:FL=1
MDLVRQQSGDGDGDRFIETRPPERGEQTMIAENDERRKEDDRLTTRTIVEWVAIASMARWTVVVNESSMSSGGRSHHGA